MKFAKYLLFMSLFITISCKKNDVDFNKYNSAKLNPELYSPLGQTILRARDIFKPDSTLTYDAEGNIKYVFPADTFLNIKADTLLNGVKLGKSVSIFELGNVSLFIDDKNTSTTLRSVNKRNTEPSKSTIEALDGTTNFFPGISVSNLDIDTLPTYENFTYIFVKKGVIYCEIKNNWPGRISEMTISLLDLTNNSPSGQIGSFKFLNIEPAETGIDSIVIGDKQINNQIGTKIESVALDGSSNKVNINLNAPIEINLSFSEFRISEGLAKIPEQLIPKRFASIDLSQPDSKELLKTVEFGNALIPIAVTSTFGGGAVLRLSLPDALKGGSSLTPIEVSVDKGSTSTSVDLSNTTLDMGQDPSQPFNMLRIEFDGKLKATDQQVIFKATDDFKIEYDATGSEFTYADGYLGSDTFEVFLKNLNVSQLTDFLENLKIENPNMTVNVNNSFGVPSEVELIVTAKSKDGKSLKLDIDKMLPSYPTISERGSMKKDNFYINNSNSNFSTGLKLPAETFDVTARVIFNQNGFEGYTNHLVNNSVLVVSFGAEIPLEMSASNITYYDTIDATNTFNSIGSIQDIELKLQTENLFPFDAKVDLFFVDNDYITIDSNTEVQLVKSAIVDSDGTPETPSILKSEFFLTRSTIENFKIKQPRHIIVRASLSTTDNGSRPVKILQKCYLKTNIALRTVLNTTL